MRNGAQSGNNGNDRERFSVRDFLRSEASASILLLICHVVALIWANSPWRTRYGDL